LAVIGVVVVGTMLTSRPVLTPRPAKATSVSIPVVEQPASSTAPDFGSLDEDIGSVVVVSRHALASEGRGDRQRARPRAAEVRSEQEHTADVTVV